MRKQTFIVPGRPNTNHRPRSMSVLEIEGPVDNIVVKLVKPVGVNQAGRRYTKRSEAILEVQPIKLKASSLQYMDDKYTVYMGLVVNCAKQAKIEMYDYAKVTVEIHVPMLITDFVKKQNVVSERRDRCDVDNMKAIMDGLKGIAYKDDKDVIWECPYIVPEIPNSQWFTQVIIEECHWTDFISPEAIAWCEKNNVKIPYPSEPERKEELF